MNVLVLNIPRLHVGYLGCYGNEWIQTPQFDRLAAESVVFDRHIADCLGAPSTAWTGRYWFPLGDAATEQDSTMPFLMTELERYAVDFRRVNDARLDEVTDVIKSLQLAACAKRWLCWIDLPSLVPPWDVADEIVEQYFAPQAAANDDTTNEESTEDSEAAEPLAPLMQPATGPIDVHDFQLMDRLCYSYAAAVSATDEHLGELLEALEQHNVLDETILVVTSDRGLALGEHGIVGDHRAWLHDEVVHLPLIVRLPLAEEAGRRIAGLTQPIDLLPTFLDALGVPASVCDGKSLLPLALGEANQIRDYACSGWAIGDSVEWALRTCEWAFLLPTRTPPGDPPRGPQLYVKPDDRWEVNDLVQHHQELAEDLEKKLREFVVATRWARS